MMLNSRVRLSRAASSSAISRAPPFTDMRTTSKPSASSRRSGSETEGCWSGVVTIRMPRQEGFAWAVPKRAMLFASVPLPVKIRRLSCTAGRFRIPIASRTARRDSVSSRSAAFPAEWREEGLPHTSSYASAMALRTSGAKGVVAELSRYNIVSPAQTNLKN